MLKTLAEILLGVVMSGVIVLVICGMINIVKYTLSNDEYFLLKEI